MKLTVKQGRGNKIHIYADGEYQATVDSDFWYSESYKNKTEIDETELTVLLRAVSFRRAYTKSLDLLSRRPYAAAELASKLREKGFQEETADSVCEKLLGQGLLNDESYAEILAEELVRRKGYSPQRIVKELVFKGVDREIAQNIVESLDIDIQTRIILLVRKKYAAAVKDEAGRRRTVNALLRLGYSYYDIKSALKTFEEFEDDDY